MCESLERPAHTTKRYGLTPRIHFGGAKWISSSKLGGRHLLTSLVHSHGFIAGGAERDFAPSTVGPAQAPPFREIWLVWDEPTSTQEVSVQQLVIQCERTMELWT